MCGVAWAGVSDPSGQMHDKPTVRTNDDFEKEESHIYSYEDDDPFLLGEGHGEIGLTTNPGANQAL